MKTLYTSLDDLDSTLDRVWDACLYNEGFFTVHPKKGIVQVYKDLGMNQSQQIAEIKVLSMAGLTDLSDVFKD